MFLRVTLCNGQRLYFNEGEKICCVKDDVSGYEYILPIESHGKFVRWNKSISTDNSVSRFCNIDLTFESGHALGVVMPRIYHGKFDLPIIAFRCKDTEDRFMSSLSSLIDSSKRLRHSVGLGRRDEYLYKQEVSAPSLFKMTSYFSGEDTSWQSRVPVDFKEGLLMGLFDSYGSIQIQKRPKYAKGTPSINFMIDTTLYGVHYLAQRLLHGTDLEVSESFSYSGHSNNRTIFRLGYVKKHLDLFRKCSNRAIVRNIDAIEMLEGTRGHCTVKVPITQDKLDKVLNDKKISYYYKAKTPAIDRLVLEKSVDLNPDVRWGQVKEIAIHDGEKF